jgi:tryptophan synthase alpha chain
LITRDIESAAEKCHETGFAGVLIADLPFDEDPGLVAALRKSELPLVRLAAPTTMENRLRDLARGAEGFVYLISRTGVTGEGSGADERTIEQLRVIREETEIPVVVGFGISDFESARSVAEVADGIVVGSALVDRIGGEGTEAALDWFSGLREVLDGI